MPIPKPSSDEQQSDFVSRCMGNDTMNKEYPDQKQRAAVCNTSWRDSMKVDMKLETVNMNNIEIFETGNWKGYDFKTSDLDEAIKNYDDRVIEPYLTLDHNPGMTKAVQEFFKAMSLGFVSKLWRQSTKLMANFKEVPKLMAELIDSGAFKKRSVEWLLRLKHANGKVYKNVLEFVTFHGGNGFPALNTLADIPKLFKDCDLSEYAIKSTEQDTEKVSISFNLKQEVKSMAELGSNEVAVGNEEYKKLLAESGRLEKLELDIKARDESLETFKTSVSDKDKELIEMKTKVEDADKKSEEADKKEKLVLKDEAEKYIDERIEAKQLLPAYKDMKIADYIRISTDGDEEALKLFKSEIEDRDPVVFKSLLKKKGEGDEDNLGNIKLDYKSSKDREENEENDQDKMDEEVQIVMKRDKCDWNTAAVSLGYLRESDKGEDDPIAAEKMKADAEARVEANKRQEGGSE